MAHIRENDMAEVEEYDDHLFMNREEILVSFLCLLQNRNKAQSALLCRDSSNFSPKAYHQRRGSTRTIATGLDGANHM